MGSTRWLIGVEATRVAQGVEWDDGRPRQTAEPAGARPRAEGEGARPKKDDHIGPLTFAANPSVVSAVREYPYVYSVRYTGEYGTKQRPTRQQMMRRLQDNVLATLRRRYPDDPLKVKAGWDHLLVKSMRDVSAALRAVPGIQFFARVKVLPLGPPEALYDTIADFFRPAVEGRTFGVRTRVALKKRKGHFLWKRRDSEVALGDRLYGVSRGVDLTAPDVFCYVEVRDDGIFLFTEKVPGMGGLPVGFTGRSLMLFSGGIDSPVAAWMAYRSGVALDFVYFDLGGDVQRDKAAALHRLLVERHSGQYASELRIIDFAPIIAAIKAQPERFQNLLLKVFFYRVGEALIADDPDTVGLVTGEAMGQVSTQTIHNLALLQQMTTVPIWRPLLFMPKDEIMKTARAIGTFDMAYTGKEFCALASRHVATRTHPNKIRELLAAMPVEDLIQSVLAPPVKPSSSVEPPSADSQETVLVDLRSRPEPIPDLPPAITWKPVPFQQAWNAFLEWPTDKTYVVVCDAGQQSEMLSRFMQEQGYRVVNVSGGIQHLHEFLKNRS